MFQTKSGLSQFVYNVKTLGGHCNVGESVTTSGDDCRCGKA